eukprot:13698512-Heterocapsa_arctica.AAC.1
MKSNGDCQLGVDPFPPIQSTNFPGSDTDSNPLTPPTSQFPKGSRKGKGKGERQKGKGKGEQYFPEVQQV